MSELSSHDPEPSNGPGPDPAGFPAAQPAAPQQLLVLGLRSNYGERGGEKSPQVLIVGQSGRQTVQETRLLKRRAGAPDSGRAKKSSAQSAS